MARPDRPKPCKRLPATATKAELREAHKAKMVAKAARRGASHKTLNDPQRVGRLIAQGSRYLPHQGERETLRRIRRHVGKVIEEAAL